MKTKAYIASISSVLNQTIKNACKNLGVDPVVSQNEKLIVEEIKKSKPQLIFIQSIIIEDNKKNLITLIKEDKEIENSHIIIHSTRPDGADFAYRMGADGFLPIPFRKEQFESILRHALNLPKKILIISQEHNLLEDFYNKIEDSGFTIVKSNSIEQGIKTLRRVFPDMVLCDLNLPDGSANIFCTKAKNNKLFIHIPILVLSKVNDVKTIEACFQSGAKDILLPPFDSEDNLKKLIDTVSPHTKKQETVLVVDDSMVIRNLISKMFKQLGFIVLTAKEGQEGIDIALREKPDLITSDYDMPVMDGWEFCSKLRENKETKDIPVIMVTSRDSQIDKKKSKVLGISSYLTKPFNAEDLKKAVKENLQQARQKQEHKTLSKYIAQDTLKRVEKYISQGENIDPEEKFISILFTDICGFSAKCENISTKKVIQLLNSFFEIMVDVLLANDAIIDKFIGDAIVARFDSDDRKKDAYQAVKSAMEMLEALKVFNNDSFEDIAIRIGINSGNVILGNIGCSKHRLDYTMIGDNVNITERLENAAPTMSCLIAKPTFELIKDHVEVGELKKLKVKGKQELVIAYLVKSITNTYE